MDRWGSTFAAAAAGLLLIAAAGCDPGLGALAPVHGKVKFRGGALDRGTIVFTPDGQRGTSGPLSRATIGLDGTYRLKTEQGLGAIPGWHRITILAVDPPLAPLPGEPFSLPRPILPGKYGDPELSGLTCEVKARQDNQIDFNLD